MGVYDEEDVGGIVIVDVPSDEPQIVLYDEDGYPVNEPVLAHLAGQHDQSSHGKGTAGTLASGYASGVATSVELGGGKRNDGVSRVIFNDGSTGVIKKVTDAPYAPAAKDITNEVLGSEVLSALGMDYSVQRGDGENEIVATFVEGKIGTEVLGKKQSQGSTDKWAKKRRAMIQNDEGVRAGVADYVLNNTDRHSSNWVQGSDGKITLIDNARSFVEVPSGGMNVSPFVHANGAALGLTFDVRGFVSSIGPNKLSPSSMTKARKKLKALKPRFTAEGRSSEFESMMSRFETLASNAAGEISL